MANGVDVGTVEKAVLGSVTIHINGDSSLLKQALDEAREMVEAFNRANEEAVRLSVERMKTDVALLETMQLRLPFNAQVIHDSIQRIENHIKRVRNLPPLVVPTVRAPCLRPTIVAKKKPGFFKRLLKWIS
jgi:microcompartment protein CcmL/EutN